MYCYSLFMCTIFCSVIVMILQVSKVRGEDSDFKHASVSLPIFLKYIRNAQNKITIDCLVFGNDVFGIMVYIKAQTAVTCRSLLL